MTKKDIVKIIHDKTDYYYDDINNIIDLFLETVIDGLKEDDKVMLSGFGTFDKYYQESYIGVNPSTGEELKVEGGYRVRFGFAKKAKDEITKK